MHTGVELDALQCIAYKPEKKWEASPEFVRLFKLDQSSTLARVCALVENLCQNVGLVLGLVMSFKRICQGTNQQLATGGRSHF